MTKLDEAIRYREEMQWSVIPLIAGDKRPPFEIKKYREQLATVDEIREWWKRDPNFNVGVVTGVLSNLFVVDLDKYKPEYDPSLEEKYFDSVCTPTDKTPRGGNHLYFRYPQGGSPTNGVAVLPAIDYRGENGIIMCPPSVFDGKMSEWLISTEECPLDDVPWEFLELIKKSHQSGQHFLADTNTGDFFSVAGRRDNDLFSVSNALVKGGMQATEIAHVLKILGKSCDPPLTEKEIDAKVSAAIKFRGERNYAQETREWIMGATGTFTIKDIYQHLSILDSSNKRSCRKEVYKLKEKGLIAPCGSNSDKYRILDLTEEVIDLSTAKGTSLDIRFPLDIHDLVKIMEKNIILLAGDTNAGKTAFLLNMAWMNASRDWKIKYLSSEMGAEELVYRLKAFGISLDYWSDAVTFVERSSNFEDLIDPEAINIIDYLELAGDDFPKANLYIRQIFDKLTTGIAIIATQKKKGSAYGRGGDLTSEKPRLSLAMAKDDSVGPNGGKLTITKAKIPVDFRKDPERMERSFTIKRGCEFVPMGDWGYPVASATKELPPSKKIWG